MLSIFILVYLVNVKYCARILTILINHTIQMLTSSEGYQRDSPTLYSCQDESRWIWRKIFVENWRGCELGGNVFSYFNER